ncbi:MAG: 4-hydroxy-3-methylbut-2-enyl diphosphate reductase [Bacteroidia bacterium]|nr:4-hydroxy-3-methylbut-2-enyl diphosphate reductase [Bacteroidia bacterium]
MNGFLPVVKERLYRWLQPAPESLRLQVDIDPASGFCFGVVYAVEMAEEILRSEGKLYCLGDIVHNDAEVERLADMGLIIIDHAQMAKLRDEKVLIRAHGEPPQTYRLAIENNLQLIDASCPVILKLQQRIRHSYENGENVYIYGKKDHAEVVGLKGQTNNTARVFLDTKELETEGLPENLTLYSQTTKNKRRFREVAQELEKKGTKVKAHDTICRQVSHRDQELGSFVTYFDKVVFVAGKKSSNGKMLFNVCKKKNPNTYFVSSKEELRKEWFRTGDKVGICGATSTPQWLMQEIKENLKQW